MTNQELNDERNNLNRNIRTKRGIIKNMEGKISDLEKLKTEKEDLIVNTKALMKSFGDLTKENESETKLRDELAGEKAKLIIEKTQLLNFIEVNTPLKKELEDSITSLNATSHGLVDIKEQHKEAIKDLEEKKKELNSKNDSLTKEQNDLEGRLKEFKIKFKLYSKDMKEMSKDSDIQLKIYSVASIAFIGITLFSMWKLIEYLTIGGDPFSSKIYIFFADNPQLRFWSVLLIRVSLSAIIIFFIIIFLNLSRGFISQYIKTRNRLTSLRVTDFLIGKLEYSEETDEEERIKELEREKLTAQIELLKEHIPKLMDLGSSSFDKISKTKNPASEIAKKVIKSLDRGK